MIDFSPAKNSGLRQQGELDKLFGVSFAMTNAYLRGRAIPRRSEVLARVQETLRVLRELIEKEKLPLSEDRDADSRAAAVEKIKSFVSRRLQQE